MVPPRAMSPHRGRGGATSPRTRRRCVHREQPYSAPSAATISGRHAMKAATGTTVITNGQLIDGTGKPPVRDAVLVLRDGRIDYAGPVAGAPRLEPDTPK